MCKISFGVPSGISREDARKRLDDNNIRDHFVSRGLDVKDVQSKYNDGDTWTITFKLGKLTTQIEAVLHLKKDTKARVHIRYGVTAIRCYLKAQYPQDNAERVLLPYFTKLLKAEEKKPAMRNPIMAPVELPIAEAPAYTPEPQREAVLGTA